MIIEKGVEVMICPYCNQGKIEKAKLKTNNIIIFICEECDTVWRDNEKISNNTGEGFDFFAEKLNINPVWDELELL